MYMLYSIASSTAYADDFDEAFLGNSLIIFEVDELIRVIHLKEGVRNEGLNDESCPLIYIITSEDSLDL